jgi:hypothetical protein
MNLRHPLRNAASDAPDEGSAPVSPTPTDTPAQGTPLPSPASSAPVVSDTPVDVVTQHADAYAGFDPNLHRMGADGKPVMTPTGRFAKKSKSGQSAPVVSTGTNVPKAGVVGVKADNLPIAKQTVNIGIGLAVRFLGAEWEPRDLDSQGKSKEAAELAFAFRDYFDARGVPQMPPEVVLLLAVTAYAMPRLNHENTKSRIARLFERARDWRDSLRKPKAAK